MLTCSTLFDTLKSLSNYREYREGSLGYLPFLLHAKWEQDNGKEQAVDFSEKPYRVIRELCDKYQNDDVGKLLYITSWSIHQQKEKDEMPEIPSEAVLSYAIQTLNTLDLSEKNLNREDLVNAFNLYLTLIGDSGDLLYLERTERQKVTENVLQKISGETESVYDPFCGDGYALSLANAKESRGCEENAVLSLIAKIHLDFMGRTSQINPVSAAEHPEITPDGKLKTYPFVISCLNDITVKNEVSIVSRDIYNRFNETVHPYRRMLQEEGMNPITQLRYRIGIMLGHALAVSTERCILFSNSAHGSINILFGMDQAQINSFIYSDILEAVISIAENDDGKRFRSKSSTIYIFNKKKDESHRGKVFFLNATTDSLSSDDIVRMYQNTEEVEGVSKLIPLSQISDKQRDCLSAVRYTAVIEKQNTGSISSILHELHRLEERNTSLMNDILEVANSISLDTARRIERRRVLRRS